jgi:hypothetical protein
MYSHEYILDLLPVGTESAKSESSTGELPWAVPHRARATHNIRNFSSGVRESLSRVEDVVAMAASWTRPRMRRMESLRMWLANHPAEEGTHGWHLTSCRVRCIIPQGVGRESSCLTRHGC